VKREILFTAAPTNGSKILLDMVNNRRMPPQSGQLTVNLGLFNRHETPFQPHFLIFAAIF